MDNESKALWDSLRRITTIAIPSRFKEDDICYFQSDLTKVTTAFGGDVDDYSGAVLCKIISVKFDRGKVLYDIAVIVDGEFYVVRPFKEIDSCFIIPREESETRTCPSCGGSGTEMNMIWIAIIGAPMPTTCSRCGGSGKVAA